MKKEVAESTLIHKLECLQSLISYSFVSCKGSVAAVCLSCSLPNFSQFCLLLLFVRTLK